MMLPTPDKFHDALIVKDFRDSQGRASRRTECPMCPIDLVTSGAVPEVRGGSRSHSRKPGPQGVRDPARPRSHRPFVYPTSLEPPVPGQGLAGHSPVDHANHGWAGLARASKKGCPKCEPPEPSLVPAWIECRTLTPSAQLPQDRYRCCLMWSDHPARREPDCPCLAHGLSPGFQCPERGMGQGPQKYLRPLACFTRLVPISEAITAQTPARVSLSPA